ncbi:cytochrome oxidase putative small subunit CydP [Pseudomonas knackmussii]|uniref:cytochrome oxidase putative small subunit CydP n=1 Tax=Pseudomonas knackmussii TaxID=65741 RepID=UPI003F4A2224
MPVEDKPFWKIPLAREIAVILVIKLALLLAIKAIWFDHPTVPADGDRQVSAHLLGKSASLPTPSKETP